MTMLTTYRRTAMGLVTGLAALSLAACGSDSSDGNPFGGPSGAPSQSASGGFDSSAPADSSEPSDGASVSSSASEGSGGSGSSDSSDFCDAYNLDVVKNAGTDPKAARDVLEKAAETAPPQIKSDAELIFRVLDDAVNGKAPTESSTEIRNASANVARYYAENCQ